MRIRPYIEAAFARDWEFEEVDHYPLLEDLNNSLRPFPASFSRESEKYLIEGEIMAHKEPDVPAFLDVYLDLPVKGLMLEQRETNQMRQSRNVLASPWQNIMNMGCSLAPDGISPSDTLPAFRFNIKSVGLNWGHGWTQTMPHGIEYVHSAMFRVITPGKTAAMGRLNEARAPRVNGVGVPLPTGNIYSDGDAPLSLVRDIQVGEWRYVEGRRSYTLSEWRAIGYLGYRPKRYDPSWSYYGFGMTMQERFYSSKIFTGASTATRAADILTVKSPQGLKQNKISFDFQYMPQGHSKQYEAVNFNDEVRLLISEYSGYVNIRTMIGNTPYDIFNIVTPDLKDTTFKVEILSVRNNNIRVKISVNDEEYISEGVLRDNVLLAEDMTVKGWCVLSNLKVYAGY